MNPQPSQSTQATPTTKEGLSGEQTGSTHTVQAAQAPEDDFFSDAPLAACPLRRPDDPNACEACQ